MSEEVLKAQIAFIVVQTASGSYLALTNLDTKVEAIRPASLQDIKVACREIGDAVVRADLVNAVKGLLEPQAVNTEETSAPEAQ